MIQNTHRYAVPFLRTWTFLSQSRLWLKRPSESVAGTNRGSSPSQTVSPDQSLQGTPEHGQGLDSLDQQSPEAHLWSLVVLCRELTRHYQLTPEVALERWWWRALHQAGVRLRDSLEEACAFQDALSLTRPELEQAYFLLIHVAYFFEPGGVAEAVCQEQGWPPEAQEFARF